MPAMPAARWATLMACLLVATLPQESLQARTLAASASNATTSSSSSKSDLEGAEVERYVWRVTVGVAAPDCYERPVVLVNGQLQPKLEVTQGNILELTVINDLPPEWPDTVSGGISIHFHGFIMKDLFWYDGNAFVSQCPFAKGKNMTYRFPVNELPGTYMWHSHSGPDEAEGLSGPLIVQPRPGQARYNVDAEHVLLLSDWFHTLSTANTMPLNRPFTNATANQSLANPFTWVGVPQAILLNGRGFYGDCAMGSYSSTATPLCNVTAQWVPPGRSAQQPFASMTNPGCAHHNITVAPNSTNLIRLLNAGSLTYLTVCFGGHTVTVVEEDGFPIQPFTTQCLDINLGQRFDVLLKADQPPGAYWISAQVQFRSGSPSGYGILRYAGTDESALPSAPLPQPASVAPWGKEQFDKIVMASDVIDAAQKQGGMLGGTLVLVPNATAQLVVNITQPLLRETGQIRWAMNNVANTLNPPCRALGTLMRENPRWLKRHLVKPEQYNSPGYGSRSLGIQEGKGKNASVFLSGPQAGPPPIYPVAGTHLVPVPKGTVVEVVVQNLPADANNGDFGSVTNRTSEEQHPIHLHGHNVWVLGRGQGRFNESARAQLNTVNPPLVDTFILPQQGWVLVRFVANNPGLWAFHCHIMYHRMMGQMLHFVTAVDELPEPPAGRPSCPKKCSYSTAPWNVTFVKDKYGASGFEVPI